MKKIRTFNLLRQRSPDEGDPAAAVAAPGQEAFRTPDLNVPEEVSDDSTEQFGGNVDWNDALDDSLDEEPPAEDSEEAAPVEESESEPEPNTEETETVPEAAISDEEAAAAVATETEDDFQPGAVPGLEKEPEPVADDWEKAYADSRKSALQEIEGRYALTEEERDKVLTNPEEVLPRLAANLYVDVFESVLGAVNTMLPGRFTELSARSIQAAEYSNQFYEAWPTLRSEEGEREVARIGMVYRELHKDKGYTPEEFIRDVGTQASVALKLPIPGITEVSSPEEASPTPHKPAGPATTQASIPDDPRQSNNQYERLSVEFEEDDD